MCINILYERTCQGTRHLRNSWEIIARYDADRFHKNSDGDNSEVVTDEKFKKLFNIMGDKPETVANSYLEY